MTLSEARTYVLGRLGISSGDSATVDALLDLQLNLEYQRLVLKYQLEVDVANLVTTADDAVVDLPDDLNEILKINLGDTTLIPVEWDEFADLNAASEASSSTEQTPTSYVRSGARRIRVHPTPTADGSDLTCWYASSVDDWDADAEEPVALPAAFHDLPCERVVAFLAALDEALDLAAVATARADTLESEFRRHIGRRGGIGPSAVRIRGTV